MALPADLSLSIAFNVSTELFTLTDNTTWGAGGYPLATSVKEYFTITGPDGQVWWSGSATAYDINPAVSTTNTTIPIPTDVNGDIQQGTYTIVQSVFVTGGIQPGTHSKTYTVEYCSDQPTLSLNINPNIFCGPSILATDETSYTTTSGTWSILSRVITLTNAYNLASPQNTTNTANGPTATVTTNIYPGIWNYSMSVSLQLVTSTHTCTVTLITSGTFTVTDLGLCEVICCINALNTRYENAVTTGNNFLIAELTSQMGRVQWFYNYMTWNAGCGFYANATNALASIQTLLNCTSGCGCNDGTPSPLVAMCPSSGAGSSYTFSALNGLVLTQIGNAITYGLSTADRAVLDNAYNSVVTNSDGTITVTPATTPGNPDTTTYTLALNTTNISKELNFELVIGINAGAPPTLTVANQTNNAVIFQAPTLTNAGYVNVNSNAIVRVSNFLISPGSTFKHHVQVTDITLNSLWPGFGTQTAQQLLIAGYMNRLIMETMVINKGTNTFDIQFSHQVKWPTGSNTINENPSWNKINLNFTQIRLTVNITL